MSLIRRFGRALTLAFAFALGSGVVTAQPAPDARPPVSAVVARAPTAAPPLTTETVDRWLDGFMPYALKSSDIAGAVVVVVRDGQILTQRGFGVSDVENGRPVDPRDTLFRIGSVSKLIAWTAVMQMVEQGRIDLDRDVNDYLDFHIPDYEGRPITMRQLMSHTGGFEEKAKWLIVYDAPERLTLEQSLKIAIPRRVDAPGSVVAYSNYGASLAGYIVQRVSGEPFDRYVERHIFAPLGMGHSTFDQPLSAGFNGVMSRGYSRASAPPERFEIVNFGPAGGMTSTASDMGAFMIAHLQQGRFGEGRILREETVRLMHDTVAMTPTPPLPGMGLGFYRSDRNGQVILSHAGDTNFFHSEMHILPRQDVGIFVSFNSTGRDGAAGQLRGEMLHRFMDRYYPVPDQPLQALPTAREHGEMMAGSWLNSRRFESSFLKMIYLIQPATVAVLPNGDLIFSPLNTLSGAPKVWRETAPFVWREVNGDARLAAVVKDGRVVSFTSDDLPPVFVFRPAPAWISWGWTLTAALAVMAAVVIVWPLSALLRWRFQRPRVFEGRDRLAYHLSRINALIALACAGGYLTFIMVLEKDVSVLSHKSDVWVRVLQLLALLLIPGAATAIWNAANAWRRSSRTWSSRVGATGIAVAALVIVVYVFALNLLTLRLDY